MPEREPVYLSDEECLRFLETITQKARPQVKERDMAIAVLLLHTGLRVSELTNLKLSNVDLERSQIKITRKGAKEQYLHLNGEAASVLVNYLHSRPHHTRLPRFAHNDKERCPLTVDRVRITNHGHDRKNSRFFVGTNGGSLSRTYVYRVVRRYLNLAGIDKGKQGPHLLRHTFCTRLHQKGASPFVIKELAGHKSLNTTMKYIRIENKEQSEALDRLEFGML